LDVLEQGQLTLQQAFDHWYYKAQFHHIAEFIRAQSSGNPSFRMADVGCGMGLYMMMLEKKGVLKPEQMCGIDTAYKEKTKVCDGGSFIYPAFPDGEVYDFILMAHVLEHIRDDLSMLKSVAEKCRKGGMLFISVPAFQFLWSSHDVFLGHLRRYNNTTLAQLIRDTKKLHLNCSYYYYASILPGVLAVRFLRKIFPGPVESDLKPAGKIATRLILSIMAIEDLIAHRNRVAGLSVIAICKA
jgi:SAM-dependent methyltransferase